MFAMFYGGLAPRRITRKTCLILGKYLDEVGLVIPGGLQSGGRIPTARGFRAGAATKKRPRDRAIGGSATFAGGTTESNSFAYAAAVPAAYGCHFLFLCESA